MRAWIGLALAVAAVSVWGGARAATPMSMAAFRAAYVAEVAKDFPGSSVKVIADDVVQVTDSHGGVATAYLDNAYAHYRQDPAQLDAILKRYVGDVVVSTTEVSYTAAQLRILVRPASYLTMAGARGMALLHRPVAGDLFAFVAVDEPTKYLYPRADELRKTLGLDDDAIWARALENTARVLPGVPPQDAKKAIDALTCEEGLASSVLAESEWWDRPELQVGGPPVVAPVAKNMVLVTHLGDPKGVAALRKIAARSAGDADGLTDQLFVRRNGAWEVLPP